ncbi:MAG: FKBP-type peptidyl-prolyl cis-trans isomerase [Chitinophagia bacterium]
MKNTIILALATLGSISGLAQTKQAIPAKTSTAVKTTPVTKSKLALTYTAAQSLKTTKDSASYALGYRIAQSLKGQGLQDVNMALFNKGMAAGVIAKSAIPDSLIDLCIKNYQDKMSTEKIAINRAAGAAFLAENAKRPGVVRLSNGLQYEVMVAGTDTTKPTLKNTVKCHYHGTLIDGTVFDSSVQRGEPISFPLNGVIKGWQEALQLMTVGSKWKLFIPSELAYGERSAGPVIGPGSTLIFEVELLGVQ